VQVGRERADDPMQALHRASVASVRDGRRMRAEVIDVGTALRQAHPLG
jgi:hypothetical protein